MAPAEHVTIACVQMDVVDNDVDATRTRVVHWLDKAALAGANIVLFPELILAAGYSLGERFFEVAEPIPGPSTYTIAESARRHAVYVVAGLAERDPTGTLYNSAVIVGPDGKLVGSYRKTHVFTPTEPCFAQGTTLPVFDLDFGRVAIPICYDLEFPETGRVLCLRGAQLLLTITAHAKDTGTVGTPQNFIRTIYAARALENRVPVALCNRVGYDAGIDDHFVGLSRIVDADGLTLNEMSDDSEDMIMATLDLEEERRKRQRYNYFRDRKPSLYLPVTQPTKPRSSEGALGGEDSPLL